jgi:TRAP-type C4-dicarboxylate transport system permease small subunit
MADNPGGPVDRLFERTLFPIAVLAGLMLGLLSIMVTADVAVRWITGRPLIGVFEVAETMLVYCTFLALAYVQLKNQQLRVDILSSRARGRVAGLLNALECIASLFVYGAIALFAGREWVKAYYGGFLRRGMFEIPNTYLLAPITIGAALVVLVLIWQFVKACRQVATGIEMQPPPASPTEISI